MDSEEIRRQLEHNENLRKLGLLIHEDCIYYSGNRTLKCAVNPTVQCVKCSEYVKLDETSNSNQ